MESTKETCPLGCGAQYTKYQTKKHLDACQLAPREYRDADSAGKRRFLKSLKGQTEGKFSRAHVECGCGSIFVAHNFYGKKGHFWSTTHQDWLKTKVAQEVMEGLIAALLKPVALASINVVKEESERQHLSLFDSKGEAHEFKLYKESCFPLSFSGSLPSPPELQQDDDCSSSNEEVAFGIQATKMSLNIVLREYLKQKKQKRKEYRKRLMKRNWKYEKFTLPALMRIVNGETALAKLKRKIHRCYLNRLRFNNNLAFLYNRARALSFTAVLVSCLRYRTTEKVKGSEEAAQGKPGATPSEGTYTQYRVTAKVADESCPKPLKLVFFSQDPHGVPPPLPANECALIVVDNGRMCAPHDRSKPVYLSANDTSGWAVYSLDGELRASHNYEEVEDLNKALEGAKNFVAEGAEYMRDHPEEAMREEFKDMGRWLEYGVLRNRLLDKFGWEKVNAAVDYWDCGLHIRSHKPADDLISRLKKLEAEEDKRKAEESLELDDDDIKYFFEHYVGN